MCLADAYGPGQGYHCFAGKECSVALAKMSFEEQYMNCYLRPKQPKLEQKEIETMEQWFVFIKKKYPIIGKIKETKKDHWWDSLLAREFYLLYELRLNRWFWSNIQNVLYMASYQIVRTQANDALLSGKFSVQRAMMVNKLLDRRKFYNV